ncbi:glycosyltransferase [Flectobacillus major]|uniref:glycosyltransferase n=1 Tax=Flectobacillus major TaxID=103 RepID=UPI000419DEAD|nr:glycosyltransferase [Flectobacillus major]
MKIKITYIITSLGLGGAETMLYKLVKYSLKEQYDISVISLIDESQLATKFREIGVEVYILPFSRTTMSPLALWYLIKQLRILRPQIIHTWLYHAHILGGLASLCLWPRSRVIWNLRNTLSGVQTQKLWFVVYLCKYLSSILPHHIISCSEKGALEHRAIGFRQPIKVIPNGFEKTTITHDSNLVLPRNKIIIGLIARFSPEKDHQTFIQAAQIFIEFYPEALFVLCGKACDSSNTTLIQWLSEANLLSTFILLGEQPHVNSILCQLSICTLSSYSEGFPNILGEAMASEVLCVSTNAGDAALLLGNNELIVPCKNPTALAYTWKKVLGYKGIEQKRIKKALRFRVEHFFSMEKVAQQYDQLHQSII